MLLAATAYLLVHHANVWDDARTVLLLVVLMFLATSVTFDRVLVFMPRHGAACNVVGLVFAAVVSEGVIAAALTGFMILVFLGSWRSTLIITVSIPLAVLCSLTALSLLGRT